MSEVQRKTGTLPRDMEGSLIRAALHRERKVKKMARHRSLNHCSNHVLGNMIDFHPCVHARTIEAGAAKIYTSDVFYVWPASHVRRAVTASLPLAPVHNHRQASEREISIRPDNSSLPFDKSLLATRLLLYECLARSYNSGSHCLQGRSFIHA